MCMNGFVWISGKQRRLIMKLPKKVSGMKQLKITCIRNTQTYLIEHLITDIKK